MSVDNRAVTVLLPVRDGGRHIDAALASLMRQTLRSVTVVVIDDGSTDATPDIVRSWAKSESRIRLITTEPVGLVQALELGRAEVTTPYVARMDADDISHPERLSQQLRFLEEHPELSGCGTGVTYFPSSRVTDRAREYQDWLNGLTTWEAVERDLFIECPLAHPTFMFRTQALEFVDGYRDMGWPEDYDLLLRLWRSGHRFCAVPRTLLDWQDRGDRLSRTSSVYSLENFRSCRIYHLRESLLRGGRSVVIWGAGPTGKALALEFQAQGVTVDAFVEVDEGRIGQTIHEVPVTWVGDAPGKGPLHVGGVARAEGRAAVREAVDRCGLQELEDFIAMA